MKIWFTLFCSSYSRQTWMRRQDKSNGTITIVPIKTFFPQCRGITGLKMHQLRTRGANFRESVCGYLNWAFVETTIRSNKPATPRTTEEEQSAQNDIIIIPYVAECQKSSGGSSANIVFWCISNPITLRQKQNLHIWKVQTPKDKQSTIMNAVL